jgi:FAD/FMN-containing dehydrogenase
MKLCADMGGTISGEHGIGVEKLYGMPLVFSSEDLAAMRRIKKAFDAREVLNPGKVLPAAEA